MKIKLRATVIYEWEEDSESWSRYNPQTEEELLRTIQNYIARDDFAYVLEMGFDKISVEKI